MFPDRPRFWRVFPLFAFAVPCLALLAISVAAAPDTLLVTMQKELQRASAALATANPAPHFMSYAVTDLDSATVVATNGSLIISSHEQERHAEVTMRVGSPALDNTHGQGRRPMTSGFLP
jgi:hypothetical protein